MGGWLCECMRRASSELRWTLARACTCGALVLPATPAAEQLCRRAVVGGDFIGVSLLELSRSPPESQEVTASVTGAVRQVWWSRPKNPALG